MSLYESLINILNYFGIFNILLPFLLIYAIMYGILMRTKIFGDPFSQNQNEAKAARTIISLVSASVAFLVISSINFITTLKTMIPYFILYIIVLFMLILSISIFYLPEGQFGEDYKRIRGKVLIVALIIFIIVTLNFFGLLTPSISSSVSNALSQYQDLIAGIVIFALLILAAYYISKPPKQSQSEQKK